MNNTNYQSGQTLIETLVAAFILVMGISAAVALGVYSLRATNTVSNQLVASGLAREGVEAIKNMRDTNWLQDSLQNNCYDFYSGGSASQPCYQNWLSTVYNIDPGSSQTYALTVDTGLSEYWSLHQTSSDYGLDYLISSRDNGFYGIANNQWKSAQDSNSGFARKITLSTDTFGPFSQSFYERLKVTVDVWWVDRNCPVSNDVPSDSKCKISLETYLTNWKNY